MRRLLALFMLAFGLALSVPAVGANPVPPVNADPAGLAIRGYDPTAYFTAGRAVQGAPEYEYRWSGATWRFASAEARARFAANPEAFAPAYGGYCAWAVSQNYVAPGDPNFWRIVDGRLYLNFNARAKELWERDVAGAIARGNANWPAVLATAGNI
jgi:YHS domain-containing protein